MKTAPPTLLLCTVALFLMVVRGSAEPESLYHKEIHTKNSHGESVDIAVKELRRDARTSTLSVNASEAALGSSVGEPMFILSCCYEMAKLRGAAYLIVLKEDVASDPRKAQYIIGFSPDSHVDLTSYFGLKEPLPKEKNEFLSVKDHEQLLKSTR